MKPEHNISFSKLVIIIHLHMTTSQRQVNRCNRFSHKLSGRFWFFFSFSSLLLIGNWKHVKRRLFTQPTKLVKNELSSLGRTDLATIVFSHQSVSYFRKKCARWTKSDDHPTYGRYAWITAYFLKSFFILLTTEIRLESNMSAAEHAHSLIVIERKRQ